MRYEVSVGVANEKAISQIVTDKTSHHDDLGGVAGLDDAFERDTVSTTSPADVGRQDDGGTQQVGPGEASDVKELH